MQRYVSWIAGPRVPIETCAALQYAVRFFGGVAFCLPPPVAGLSPGLTAACVRRRVPTSGATRTLLDGHMTAADIVPFLRAWAANPLQVAAIAPSGDALAELMTRDICAATGPVLELGPGTGVFTRALLSRGVRESNLILVEYGQRFARLLEARFPEAEVLRMDAARLARADIVERGKLGAVVSGLPLLSMQPRQVMGILAGTFPYLRADGAFYQFTYGPRCPVPRRMLDRLGLRAQRVGTALLNMPPATVYRITRRGPQPMHR